MVEETRNAKENKVFLLKVVPMLFLFGGAGGLLGAKIVTLLFGETCLGASTGMALLMVSASLAVPATVLIWSIRAPRRSS
jgi:hypothetical protein